MANVHPYIALDNTKEALHYYEEVLGAKNIRRVPVGAEQAEEFGLSEEQAAEMTMHSQFDILGTTIMAADNFQKEDLKYSGISILIDLNSEDKEAMAEALDFWKLLSESGEVTINMPFEEQFWGGAMGDFTDRYGVRWMLHAQPYSKLAEM
ncbi:VOC family protein [Lactococcus garvieae]|uniref:VOC family protein n=1 Tax=Lactococcus garvieae TaxID=1363 RepID=UPI0018DA238F|nr:glyoxalase/bleomycin resistance/extradiol dioxygenase family protein [Lactococcus garvieae]QPS71497.1 glyoxalase/bleomycin resistance/extradiol dioxygenase family protein [Lactococcus garvieae]